MSTYETRIAQPPQTAIFFGLCHHPEPLEKNARSIQTNHTAISKRGIKDVLAGLPVLDARRNKSTGTQTFQAILRKNRPAKMNITMVIII